VLLAVLYGLVVVFLAAVTAGMAASASRRPSAAGRRWRRLVLPAQLAAIVLVAMALPVTLVGDGPARRPLVAGLAAVAALTLALAVRSMLAARRPPARPHGRGVGGDQSSSTVPPERQ
jgi:hypothetical protein